MRIYAIDDEPKMLRLLHSAIAEAAPGAEILDFSSAAGGLAAVQDPQKLPDVAFSDIEMPGMNGIELAVRIKNAAPQCRIVFATGYDHYALEAFRIHAGGYLMKPVDAAAIREELRQLPEATENRDSGLYIQCFGLFEVFYQGQPLLFERRKTKELLAFLVDKRGASCTAEEAASALWEETDMKKAKHQLRNLVNDLRSALRKIGKEDLLIRRSGMAAIRAEDVACDYYELLKGDPKALNAYHGEYMSQYSWAELTAGQLWFRLGGA